MAFKSIVRELREITDGIGSISKRRFEGKHWRSRTRSHIAPEVVHSSQEEQGQWANLPPELLWDIIQRVEESETSWPARTAVLFCASVCKSWRDVTKEIIKTPEECGRITLPISLKQPGPRDSLIQCYIKRDRATSTYRLYLGLTPYITVMQSVQPTASSEVTRGLIFTATLTHCEESLVTALAENGKDKLLLAAKKIRRTTTTEFVISLVSDNFSRSSNTYVGRLRSNFLGTKFTMYDSQPPVDAALQLSRKSLSKQANYNVSTITYELNVLRTRGPRRMNCVMHTVPVSSIQEGGKAPTPTTFIHPVADQKRSISMSSNFIKESSSSDCSDSSTFASPAAPLSSDALVLNNKSPRWHEQLQCWCLNFKGRVTVASVKNFQLVAGVDPAHNVSAAEQEKVILQFGKVGKDIFTMDYRYPLSAFQAFAICLSSFDTKPACE